MSLFLFQSLLIFVIYLINFSLEIIPLMLYTHEVNPRDIWCGWKWSGSCAISLPDSRMTGGSDHFHPLFVQLYITCTTVLKLNLCYVFHLELWKFCFYKRNLLVIVVKTKRIIGPGESSKFFRSEWLHKLAPVQLWAAELLLLASLTKDYFGISMGLTS